MWGNPKIACDRFFPTAEKHPHCTSWRVLIRLLFVILDRQSAGVDKFSFCMLFVSQARSLAPHNVHTNNI